MFKKEKTEVKNGKVPKTVVSEALAPEAVIPGAVAPVAPEAVADSPTVGDMMELSNEVDKYEIPETHEGHEITSIVGMKHLGGVSYVMANCDDGCTYDVPVKLKAE